MTTADQHGATADPVLVRRRALIKRFPLGIMEADALKIRDRQFKVLAVAEDKDTALALLEALQTVQSVSAYVDLTLEGRSEAIRRVYKLNDALKKEVVRLREEIEQLKIADAKRIKAREGMRPAKKPELKAVKKPMRRR